MMLSNEELTDSFKKLQSAMEDLLREKLINQDVIELLVKQVAILTHEVKILKRIAGMGDLEPIPDADYNFDATADREEFPDNSPCADCEKIL